MGFTILRSIHRFWWVLITFTPIAILRIVGGLLLHPITRRRAWKQLPATGNKLGLSFEQSCYSSELGVITGVIEGHKIIVSPDDAGKVEIYFITKKNIGFWTSKSKERPTKSMPDFATNNWKFNAIFKTRRAALSLIKQFEGFPEVTDALVSFYTDWIWHLEYIYIDERRILCSFNYGQPFFPYIPASVLESILYDLVKLAKQVDRL